MAKSKNTMEVNGVANLTILIDSLKHDLNKLHVDGWNKACISTTVSSIEEQLDLLERYMIAYQASVEAGKPNPFWHEIKANPSAYPLNGGRIKPR